MALRLGAQAACRVAVCAAPLSSIPLAVHWTNVAVGGVCRAPSPSIPHIDRVFNCVPRRTAYFSPAIAPWTPAVAHRTIPTCFRRVQHVTPVQRFASAAAAAAAPLNLPALGDSITEGTLVEFLKGVGDTVAEDDVIAIVETDKVSVDIRATHAGTITKLCVEAGDTVEVGMPLLEISGDGASASSQSTESSAESPAAAASSGSSSAQDSTGASTVEPLNLPALGDSITEGTLVEFMKGVGDSVAEDEVVAIVETDKVSVDIRATRAGTITKLCVEAGDTVEVGKPLLEMSGGGSAPAASASSSSAQAPAAPSASPPATAATTTSTAAAPASHRRVPLIRFTHGKRDIINKQLNLPDASPSVAFVGLGGGSIIPSIEQELYEPPPPRYARKQMSAYAMELIELGGAEPY